MNQFRLNVFETNSSSTHSLIMAEDHIYKQWVKGELFYNEYNNDSELSGKEFVTKEEAFATAQRAYSWLTMEQFEKLIKGDEIENPEDEDEEIDGYNFFSELGIWPYDIYCKSRGEYLESSEYTYTTPGGEKVRALAFYGYDG